MGTGQFVWKVAARRSLRTSGTSMEVVIEAAPSIASFRVPSKLARVASPRLKLTKRFDVAPSNGTGTAGPLRVYYLQ